MARYPWFTLQAVGMAISGLGPFVLVLNLIFDLRALLNWSQIATSPSAILNGSRIGVLWGLPLLS